MTFVERPIEIWTLPIEEGVEILHPERVILALTKRSTDIGAFCYRSFSAPVGMRKGVARPLARPQSERLVDLNSLVERNIPGVRRMITHFSDRIAKAGMLHRTIASDIRCVAKFLAWAPGAGFLDVLSNHAQARVAFATYVDHLRHLVDTNQIGVNTGALEQRGVLGVLQELTGHDDLHYGVNLIRASLASRVPTQPASEDAQGRVLALCQCVFDGLSTASLEFRPFPFDLRVPPTVRAPSNSLWVFPSLRWCMPPHVLAVREKLKKGIWAFNYEEGRLAEVHEIVHRYSFTPGKGRREARAEIQVANAQTRLEVANIDRQHNSRRYLAAIAHNAFVVLFLANTGMNWSTVVELPWSDSHEVGVERQGFRAIKYRAGGRTVSFEIQTAFLPAFRQYIDLRSYLLNGKPYDLLFGAATGKGGDTQPLTEGALDWIYLTLQRLDPELPPISSMKWRASKSDWLLRKVDPTTAATVLQNSLGTVLQAYAAGSPMTQGEELGQFLNQLQATVLDRSETVSSGVVNAVGICSDYGQPHQSTLGPFPSDCKSSEGCLFCDKFKVHADDRDARKLLSCKYCIRQTGPMVGSEEQFRVLIEPVLGRIEALLLEIESREPGLVSRIAKEVEEGELDPYWARKLEMLIDLELVSHE